MFYTVTPPPQAVGHTGAGAAALKIAAAAAAGGIPHQCSPHHHHHPSSIFCLQDPTLVSRRLGKNVSAHLVKLVKKNK